MKDEFKITENISVIGLFGWLTAWVKELTARIKKVLAWLEEHKPEEDAEEEE